MSDIPLMQRPDEAGDKDEVLENLARGVFSGRNIAIAQKWLRRKEVERAKLAAAKSESREDEGLRIAKDANDIARSASFAATAAASAASEANMIARSNRRIAIAAMITAAVAAIAAVIAAYAAIKGLK